MINGKIISTVFFEIIGSSNSYVAIGEVGVTCIGIRVYRDAKMLAFSLQAAKPLNLVFP